MQDYPVIGRVLVMPVSLPITGFDMNLYVPFYYTLAGGNDRVPEISPPVIIPSSRINYPYWLTASCGQLGSVHQLLPYLNYHFLREIIWQPAPFI
jgi:hypothetical protein